MLALASEFSFEWRNVERRQCAPRPPPSGENFSYRSNSGEHRSRDPGLGLKCLLLPPPRSSSHIPQPHELFPAHNKAAENPPNKKRHWMLELPSWKKVFPFCLTVTIYSEHVYGLGEIVGDARMLDGCIRAKSVKPCSAPAVWQLAQPKYLLLWFPEQNFMSLTF